MSGDPARIQVGSDSGCRENDRTVPCDHNGVLEMRGQTAIRAAHGPAIAHQASARVSNGDDRFERDHQAAVQVIRLPGVK